MDPAWVNVYPGCGEAPIYFRGDRQLAHDRTPEADPATPPGSRSTLPGNDFLSEHDIWQGERTQ
jgi:hypothetical protein